MPEPVYSLSRADLDVIQSVLDRFRGQYQGPPPGRPRLQPDDPPPRDVYVAFTPEAGIAARTGMHPGQAECAVYRATPGEAASTLEGVYQFAKVVLNVSSTAVPGNTWVVVVQDNFGQWWATLVSGTDVTPDPGETGTGTGTFSGCAPVSFQQERLECQGGRLNVYVQTVTLNVAGGCLTLSESGWAFDRSEGPCGGATTINYPDINLFTTYVTNAIYYNQYDQFFYVNINGTWINLCNCLPVVFTGTGTGTGTGTTGAVGGTVPTNCCPSAQPATLHATVTGTKACVGTVTVTLTHTTGQTWQGSAVLGTCGHSITLSFTCSALAAGGTCHDFLLSQTWIDACGGGTLNAAPTVCACSPLSVTFSVPHPTACGGGITDTLTIVVTT